MFDIVISVAPIIGLVRKRADMPEKISVSASVINGQILPNVVQVHFR